MTQWQVWLDGLLGAVISSAAGGVTVGFVDPADFNFGPGLHKLVTVLFWQGVVGAALFLRTRPTPWSKGKDKDA
jgi:hypothetical protein